MLRFRSPAWYQHESPLALHRRTPPPSHGIQAEQGRRRSLYIGWNAYPLSLFELVPMDVGTALLRQKRSEAHDSGSLWIAEYVSCVKYTVEEHGVDELYDGTIDSYNARISGQVVIIEQERYARKENIQKGEVKRTYLPLSAGRRTRRNADPSRGRAGRDGPLFQPRSAEMSAGGANEAPVRSATGIRPARTALEARPSADRSENSQGRQPPHTSSKVPLKDNSSTSSPALVFASVPNNHPRGHVHVERENEPPYSVLAIRAITCRSGRLGASAAARPWLLSSNRKAQSGGWWDVVRCMRNADEMGSARWVRCAGWRREKVVEERIGQRVSSARRTRRSARASAGTKDGPWLCNTCVGVIGGQLERAVQRRAAVSTGRALGHAREGSAGSGAPAVGLPVGDTMMRWGGSGTVCGWKGIRALDRIMCVLGNISDGREKEGEASELVQAISSSEIMLAHRPRSLGGRISGDGDDGECLGGRGHGTPETWEMALEEERPRPLRKYNMGAMFVIRRRRDIEMEDGRRTGDKGTDRLEARPAEWNVNEHFEDGDVQ
ncbi:hypothetical protein EDB89DRAFT_1911485 [Lactarius sanguifluus]|nr:hypothetical protein EDB89DRAFT_1911485 [Lactarius sanguifluus]